MAILAHGSKINMGDGATTEVFTKLNGVGDIDYVPPKHERADVTNQDSTSREYLPALAGEGSIKFEVQYEQSDDDHKTLRDKHDASENSNFQVEFKDGTVVDVSCAVNVDFKLGIANQPQKMGVELIISGTPEYTDPV